jgi:hypothetical protein
MKRLPPPLLPLLFLLAACGGPEVPSVPMPDASILYPFGTHYACTLAGTRTTTPLGGSPSTVDVAPAAYDLNVPLGFFQGGDVAQFLDVNDPGTSSGTLRLIYDPQQLPEGAWFDLTYSGNATYSDWAQAFDGTVTATSLLGTCNEVAAL